MAIPDIPATAKAAINIPFSIAAPSVSPDDATGLSGRHLAAPEAASEKMWIKRRRPG